ncbi:MAG: nucleotidyltransferase [Chloroflexota bacterium]|nr:MAG: nucleotidyltransferase [Chloroflexota bacterium]
MTPNECFHDLLRDIEPSPTTKTDAANAHRTMRAFLRTHASFGSRHVDTYLSGSYKRDTAIRPRRHDGITTRPDVDIIVVTNHSLGDSPSLVVAELYDAVADGYSRIEKQTRSVGVETAEVDMDVVPIIEPFGPDRGLYIPDRALVAWLPTNPPGHTTWTTARNAAAGGRFKPLVKLLKWWRRQNPTTGRHPKGFIIECIAAECMDYEETHYGLLFVRTLERIVSRYLIETLSGFVPTIPDPAVAGNSVTRNVSYEEFRSFRDQAEKDAKTARRALTETDPGEMARLWREIFGPRFPATPSKIAGDLLGAPVSTAAGGLVFPDRPVQPNKPAGFA